MPGAVDLCCSSRARGVCTQVGAHNTHVHVHALILCMMLSQPWCVLFSGARRRGRVLRQLGLMCVHPLHACSAGSQTDGATVMQTRVTCSHFLGGADTTWGAFTCLASWTCAAAAGPTVPAPSACVIGRTPVNSRMAAPTSAYFFFQTQIPFSEVLYRMADLHVSVPLFRVQGRAVQSRASKPQVAHSNFCFAECKRGGGGRGSIVSDGYSDSDSVSA